MKAMLLKLIHERVSILNEHDIFPQPQARCALSRRDVRSIMFHLLYAAESLDYSVSVGSIVEGFNSEYESDLPQEGEIIDTVQGVIDNRATLDEQLKPFLANWKLERLGCCTRLVLRLALWELLYTKTPPVVVINEAIELAKCFSEKDAYKFVNGILDEAVKKMQLLSVETVKE